MVFRRTNHSNLIRLVRAPLPLGAPVFSDRAYEVGHPVLVLWTKIGVPPAST
jgi:hypothetical protein